MRTLGVILVTGGTVALGASYLGWKMEQRHAKCEKSLLISRRIAWLALKDTLETDANDIHVRIEIVKLAMLREESNQIDYENF
jgi:hypothetical protein